jgi:hypothetical protein
MSSEVFIESGVSFGPYRQGYCFRIETSKIYESMKDSGVSSVEFLLLQTQPQKANIIWIIEVKTGAPKNLDDFINEITNKFTDSLNLGVSLYLNRHSDYTHELPEQLRKLDWSTVQFRLALIITGSSHGWVTGEWLPPLQDALRKRLIPLTKIWALQPNSIFALNIELARERGLVMGSPQST